MGASVRNSLEEFSAASPGQRHIMGASVRNRLEEFSAASPGQEQS